MRAKKRESQIRDLKHFIDQLDEFMNWHAIMCLADLENEHYSEFLDLIQRDQQNPPEWIDVPFSTLSSSETETPLRGEFREDEERPLF